ncbi:hypothetical protein JA9_001434 [Meyerozyma sp. JA9]|nr:hypothetical protein JA9_001434 [Meyerozyma sp. JA9]
MSENDITVVTQAVSSSPATPRPLSEAQSLLSAQNSRSKSTNGSFNNPDNKNNIMTDYKNLERQCADLLLRNRRLATDYEHSQRDVAAKNHTITCQTDSIRRLECGVRELRGELSRTKEFYENQIFYYKDLVSQLQVRLKKMSSEIARLTSDDATSLRDEYDRLVKDFKVLQSNFELEQNSKMALMDQLEFLTRENEMLTHSNNNNNNHHVDDDTNDANDATDANDSIVHYTHVEEDPDVSNDTWDDSEGDQVSHLDQSSPVKLGDFPNLDNNRVPSLEHNPNFQFPPSPDPNAKKRQSLPAQLRSDTEFVLSPLKLANNNSSTYFDDDSVTQLNQSTHRYSTSKPNHSRYNSHDILSIKVEFEPEGGQRVSSAPVKDHGVIESIEEEESANVRGSAFRALTSSSTRNSLVSSRDSIILDHDMTKQEITKLKFELQSLRLHNEKLLSYIGFELQKQKKNIRKLSSKSSLRGLNKRFEYSDAKLIEKSKDLLIHKKRVLRSVSVNPILSKFHADSSRRFGMLHKGLLNEFPFISSDEDDYGFMNHNDLYSQRVFSSALNSYFNFDEDFHVPKKHKSQLFHRNSSFDEVSDSEDDTRDDDWEDIPEEEAEDIGIFSHIKYLLMGSAMKRKDNAVDDGLKYKFLSIAFAIMILGIRFSHDQPQHLH